MENKPLISVVLSFRNEEDVIPELISRLEKTLGQLPVDHELIFVNDRSSDGSRRLLLEKMKANKRVKLLNMSRTFGVTPCVLAGLEYSSGDAVIYMDADLQDPPEVIPEMVKLWQAEPDIDVIHTKRLSRAGESQFKLWLTRLGYAILRRVSNVSIEPEVGDFKLLSRRVVDQLVKLREKRPFMRGLVNWIGFNARTITYRREARFAGRTKFLPTSWAVISNFIDSALISFSDMPLKLSLLLGYLVSFGAFAYLIVVFIQKWMGISLPGWSAMMATMLMLGGVQLLTLGVMGLYLNAIFVETKGRPNFIVESSYGFEKNDDLKA
ncbi:MAG: glycosyltransferase family 2 protein [Candidatus Margulisbacteria bacterium]|nr:glycosyltransferase family 2 protein [Candidatus Margulisiibacteriota bacterium]